MAINFLTREEYINEVIPLGVDQGTDALLPGSYTMYFDNLNSFGGGAEYIFMLHDAFTGETEEFSNFMGDSHQYTFSITDDADSYGARRFELEIVQVITGLEELNANLLELYPNPSRGMMRYKVHSEEEVGEGVLMDVRGSVIKMINFAPKRDRKLAEGEIDLSNLRNGLYFLRTHVGQETVMKKIVIAK